MAETSSSAYGRHKTSRVYTHRDERPKKKSKILFLNICIPCYIGFDIVELFNKLHYHVLLLFSELTSYTHSMGSLVAEAKLN